MDDADFSVEIQNLNVSLAVANHLSRYREKPEFDDDGAKICIDCSTLIPPERAKLDFTVRCIDCQKEEDRRGRLI